MNYELTKHAREALEERGIPVEWMERALSAPELVLPDPYDATVRRHFRRIPEFGGREVSGARLSGVDGGGNADGRQP